MVMNEQNQKVCVCCGKPAKRHIVFYSAQEGSTSSKTVGTDRVYTTNYYDFQRHEADVCGKCSASMDSLKLSLIFLAGAIVGWIVGLKFEWDLFCAAGCCCVIGVIVNAIKAIPSEKNARINAGKVIAPGRCIFPKSVENNLKNV